VTALRAVIVDDEPLAREAIRLALRRDREVVVVGEHASGGAALAALARDEADLLFLDVRMPGLDGLEVLGQLAIPPITVVVSASSEHALPAFDLEVVDYVLKPFDDQRFARAVDRAKRHARARRDGTAEPPRSPQGRLARGTTPADGLPPGASAAEARRGSNDGPGPAHPGVVERIVIRNGARLATLATDDIDWIEAQDYYAELHAGGRTYLVRQSLHKLAASLDPARFVRIHRKTIVNVRRVKELEPLFHGEYVVFLHDGTRLKLSRTFKDHLHRLLGLA